MRLFKWLFLLLILVLLAVPPLVVWLGVQQTPLVSAEAQLGPKDVQRAEQLLRLHDPRQLKDGQERRLRLTETDLNVIGRYAFKRANTGSVLMDMQSGYLSTYLTWVLPENPVGRYLNIAVDLTPSSHTLHVDNFRIGELSIPHALAQPFVEHSHTFLQEEEIYRSILSAIREVSVNDESMELVYRWDDSLVAEVKERGREMLVSGADVARIESYLDTIAAHFRTQPKSTAVPLDQLMDVVFMHATQSSLAGDPIAENRAAITALALVTPGSRLAPLVGVSVPPDLPRRSLALRGREDFAQHFLISAGLAAVGDQGLADAVGLYKEIDDSQGGTGFSFNDLAADRAGVRFSEQATASVEKAKALQVIMSSAPYESDFMPRVDDLPEFMSKDEFTRRFGGVGAPAYEKMAADIERRIDALKIYR